MGRRFFLAIVVAVVSVAILAVSAQAFSSEGVVVRKGYQYAPAATPGQTYVSYSEYRPRRRPSVVLFVKPLGMHRVQVNKRGFALNGGIDGSKVIFEHLSRRSDDIQLYDLVTHALSKPAGVNTPKPEQSPSLSGSKILFARRYANSIRLLLHDTGTSQTVELARITHVFLKFFQSDQVNGNWATWAVRASGGRNQHGNVFRYQISTDTVTRIPRPIGSTQDSASVAADGTVYYIRSKPGCGRSVAIRQITTAGSDTLVKRLSPGYDVSKTFAVDESGGGTSVYYDRNNCTNLAKSNIYKVTIP